MAKFNAEFIERFQIEYEKNPRSRVFAALAEAYRKMGYLDEAHRICARGTQIHPDFSGGRVAFAKILLEMKRPEDALTQLKRALELSPENLLGHSLMGEAFLQLRRPKEALRSFKMVLFLNPNDQKAKAAVAKWEFLSADEYEDELFAMKPVFALSDELKADALTDENRAAGTSREVERAISLADAFTVRGEPDKAFVVLREARARLHHQPEIEKRFALLATQLAEAADEGEDQAESGEDVSSRILTGHPVAADYGIDPRERLRRRLETLLQRIEARRGSRGDGGDPTCAESSSPGER